MEIKFRAFDKKSGIMHYNYAVNNLTDGGFNIAFFHESSPLYMAQWELMQYVGWQDYKKRDLYVGDKIEIEWDNDHTTVEVISYDEYYGYFKYGNNPLCELKDPEKAFYIVGNIYESL